MNKKKKIILIMISIALAVILILNIVSRCTPIDIHDGFFYINPSNSIEFQTDNYTIGKTTVCGYVTLNEGTSDTGEDEFIITVAKVEGFFKNQYKIYSCETATDEELKNPTYFNISYAPNLEIKKSSNYYGSVYCGIVPSRCKSITFNGVEAVLKRFTFNYNGTDVDFKYYFCAIDWTDNSKSPEVVWED
ncbi:MAG: hypothetical protein ACI4IQ_01990 [Eubacterium sp.]